ncbi:hypothetical protein ACHQM5_007926 [Ranunculus cassubicifolius]
MAGEKEELEGEEKNQTPSHPICCISHQFANSASQNPNKIAVIHASGGARFCRIFHRNNSDSTTIDDDDDDFFNPYRFSSTNPALEGDAVFTNSQILASVQSLSYRIRRVLDGRDDPELITGNAVNEELPDNIVSRKGHLSSNFDTTPLIVGIYMAPSVDYIVAVLSVLRCGEAFLPLDPSWPKQRMLSIISSAKVALIVKSKLCFHARDTEHLYTSKWLLDQSGCSVLEMSMKENHGMDDPERLNLVWPCESARMRNFCYLMYTSGSTGKPKGVCGTEIGLLNRYMWMQGISPLHEDEVLLFKTPISFIDHLQEFISAILTCVPIIVPPFDEFKVNPFYIADFLKAYRISRLTIVPSVMRALLPALQRPYNTSLRSTLKVLVLSGEVFPLSLWDVLSKLLPEISILNLYGSTEVSGDCLYFDCKRLPMILETEFLSSVPIGAPISNCDVILAGVPNESSEAEIYVGGMCISKGYFLDPTLTSLDFVKSSHISQHFEDVPFAKNGSGLYYRTGDFARRIHTGDLVFMGRRDRTVKINGQRIALEESENNLREHPEIIDAAVISYECPGKHACLVAYMVLKRHENMQILESNIRSWLIERLPPAMIPNCYMCIDSLPITSSGKVDYAFLTDRIFQSKHLQGDSDITECDPERLQVIKKAFADALMIGEIEGDDDFFGMGGNSIAAAQVAYKLGIDMRLLYTYTTPYKLSCALHSNEHTYEPEFQNTVDLEVKEKSQSGNQFFGSSLGIHSRPNNEPPSSVKRLKANPDTYLQLKSMTLKDGIPWVSSSTLSNACSFSRCNKVLYEGKDEDNDVQQACCSSQYPRNRKGYVNELWKVHLKSCVDASPLIILKDGGAYLFIGSHSHSFVCVDAVSGFLLWKVELDGRIECSAAIIDDFSQVVVGCYKGKIYFLDFVDGNISWAFSTQGEVKSQPVVDILRKLIWCGSYDYNLYALDYKNYCCVYRISCGGSVYGSPSIDIVHSRLYVASTLGRVTALSLQASPFCCIWVYDVGAPVFGSLINSPNGNVICCSVDGYVTMLSLSGSVVWKVVTGGPIFAGASLSYVLPSQVLVCSRNGIIYSFELENGELAWEYDVGDPITSSAYVDENMELISDSSKPSDRLVCVCGSSGGVSILRLNFDGDAPIVREFGKMELPGEIFSSPVMIGGRVFVGCRDDFLYCFQVDHNPIS